MWCSKATNEWLVLREYAGGAEGKGLESAYSGRGGEQQVGALETKYKSSRAYTRRATDPCASRGAGRSGFTGATNQREEMMPNVDKAAN
jgi:hypothetical protein